MTEEWRNIPGTDYSVSSLGRVASLKRGGFKVLKQTRTTEGYTVVSIRSRNPRSARVHILIAAAFLPPRPTAGHEVNHKDGDKTNNRQDNLEWMTHSENVLHTIRLFGRKRRDAGNLKLTEDAVRSIRSRCSAGARRADVAAEHGISPSNVTMVTRRHTWRHVE